MNRRLLLALAMASPAHAAAPPSAADGLTYPGQSREAADFNSRWDAYMRHLPAAAPDAQMRELEWMVGSWTAQPRDFPSSMRDPADAELSPAGPATIGYTVGQRWLRISFVAEPWHVEWNYYLGHDPVSGRWLLGYLAGPSLVFDHPLTSPGWHGNRLVFGPVGERYKGFRDVVRLVVLRSARDSFRIVTEVRMRSGKYVAMDDVSFIRR
jgi:hypothetical protein